MKSLTTAWLFAMGLYSYDHVAHTVSYDATTDKKNLAASGGANKTVVAPPQPKNLFLASLLFAGLGLISDMNPNASRVTSVFAWGIDLAYFMKVAAGDTQFAQDKSQGKNSVWTRNPVYSGGPWPPSQAPNTEILPTRTGTSTSPVATPASATTPGQTPSSSGTNYA